MARGRQPSVFAADLGRLFRIDHRRRRSRHSCEPHRIGLRPDYAVDAAAGIAEPGGDRPHGGPGARRRSQHRGYLSVGTVAGRHPLPPSDGKAARSLPAFRHVPHGQPRAPGGVRARSAKPDREAHHPANGRDLGRPGRADAGGLAANRAGTPATAARCCRRRHRNAAEAALRPGTPRPRPSAGAADAAGLRGRRGQGGLGRHAGVPPHDRRCHLDEMAAHRARSLSGERGSALAPRNPLPKLRGAHPAGHRRQRARSVFPRDAGRCGGADPPVRPAGCSRR